MKLKKDIIEVLTSCATSQFKDLSFIPEKHITEAEFSYVADKILILIQPNSDSQPNGSKPDVRGALVEKEVCYECGKILKPGEIKKGKCSLCDQ